MSRIRLHAARAGKFYMCSCASRSLPGDILITNVAKRWDITWRGARGIGSLYSESECSGNGGNDASVCTPMENFVKYALFFFSVG